MNKTILLIVAVLAASGCIADDNSPASESNSNQLMEEDSVETFTTEGENMTFEVTADNKSDTFDLSLEYKNNFTGNEYFTRTDSVNLSARMFCGVAQQMAYNYSNLGNEGQSSGLGDSDDELSEGLESSTDDATQSELPSWVFEDNSPDKVKVTIFNQDKSEELATCQPTEEQLNLQLNVEEDSSNSKGLS